MTDDLAHLGIRIDSGAVTTANRELDRLTRTGTAAERMAGRLERGFDRVRRTVFSLQSAFALLGAGLVARSFISAASETEKLEIRLRALTGSAGRASQALRTVREYASSVAFTFEEISQSSALLLTVGNVQELNGLLKITGDIAAATGLSFNETAQQIQRAFSSGIASAELFRERGVAAMLGFEGGVSVSAEETRKRIVGMWEGPGSATNSLRGAAQDLSGTWEGIVSMMQDAWFNFRVEVMQGGLFDYLKGAANVVLNGIRENFGTATEAGQTFARRMIDAFETVAIGGASVLDTLRPIGAFFVETVNEALDAFNRLPQAVREIGIMGLVFFGWRGRAVIVGGLSLLDDLMKTLDAASDKFDELRGKARDALGLDPEGGVNPQKMFFDTERNPWLKDTLGMGVPAQDPGAMARAMADPGETVAGPQVPLLERSLFGEGGADSLEQKVRDLFGNVRAEAEKVRQAREAQSGRDLPGVGGSGGGISSRTRDAIAEAEKANVALRRETQAVLDGAKAWEKYKQAKAIDDEIDAMEKSLKTAGANAEAIKRLATERRFLLEAQQEAIRQHEQEQETLRFLENAGSRAFDRIGSAITQMAVEGKDAFKDLGNIGRAVIAELLQSFIELATINPIKNALFGGKSPTLSSVGGLLGGGGGSGLTDQFPDWMDGVGEIFGGGIGSWFSGASNSMLTNTFLSSPALPMAFADGGEFTVGGQFPSIRAGRDNRMVSFAARDGERVSVRTPEGRGGDAPMVVNMTLNNPTRDMIPDIIQSLQALNAEVRQNKAAMGPTAVQAVVEAKRRNPKLLSAS